MGKPKHIIKLVRVLSGALTLLLILSCSPKKSSGTKNSFSPIPGAVKNQESLEIIGKDMAGNNITKEIIETKESTTTVITTPMREIKGTVELTGTSQFNELQLLTRSNKAFVFDYRYTERFWSLQGKEIVVKGRTEERTFHDKKTGQVLRKNWLFPTD